MITAQSKKEKYRTELSNGHTTVISDAPAGKGSGQDFNPHELLCAGLASCLDITTRMVLEHKNLNYEQVIVKVGLDADDENKTKFVYDIEIVGNISDKLKQQVIDIAGNCPVKKTLGKQIEFETM